MIARAALPLLGHGALLAVARALVHDGAAPALRPRGDAGGDGPAAVHGARRGPGDAPAHPRAARGGDRALRPLGPAGHRGQRQRAARRARPARHGPLRRRPLQPLRLDGGGVGDDRDARGPARGAGHRRPPAARARWSGSSTTPAARCRHGGTGRIFVGNEMVFEGYTGGGGKEVVDGLLSTGDVGHLDAGGAPVRRRPRRRDDRVRRRERLPARGRGRPGRPRGRPGGGGRRGSGRAVRPAPAGVRRAGRRAHGPTPTSSRPTSSARWPATRCRATSCSCPSCRATPRARCSSATLPRARRGTDPPQPGPWSRPPRLDLTARGAKSGPGRRYRRRAWASGAPGWCSPPPCSASR